MEAERGEAVIVKERRASKKVGDSGDAAHEARRGPKSCSSYYKGVTKHRRTGRWAKARAEQDEHNRCLLLPEKRSAKIIVKLIQDQQPISVGCLHQAAPSRISQCSKILDNIPSLCNQRVAFTSTAMLDILPHSSCSNTEWHHL